MPLNPQERIALGRRLIIAAPKLRERLTTFYRWLPKAVPKVREPQITPIVEDDRVVSIVTPFEQLSIAEEFARRDGHLVSRVVFYRPVGGLLSEPRQIYVVELHEDHMAYFNSPEPDNAFDWDHDANAWSARNLLRLGYELAIASSEL